MADLVSPLEWLATPTHYQGLSLALGVSLTAAACTTALNGAAWSTALIGVASAAMFTIITIPLTQIYWGLQWPWWLVDGALWGIVSVIAMRSIIKGAERVYARTNDIVDSGIKRVLPTVTEGTTP